MNPTPLAAADISEVAAWYGKLSSLGDFAQRRMPAECLGAFDSWLSQAMRDGREQLGERWLDVYLTAPVLRFALAPGLVDARWWFGLLMPSCDSVGRYFPLVIAQPRARAPEDRIALDHLELWYEHLARVALRTLSDEEGGSLDSLEAALHEAPPWPTPGRQSTVTARETLHGDHLALAPAATLNQWLHGLALRDLSRRLAGCSVWWRVSEDRSGDSVDILHGLPDGAEFAALLRGD
jgi:type VI secretion system protein ImpM